MIHPSSVSKVVIISNMVPMVGKCSKFQKCIFHAFKGKDVCAWIGKNNEMRHWSYTLPHPLDAAFLCNRTTQHALLSLQQHRLYLYSLYKIVIKMNIIKEYKSMQVCYLSTCKTLFNMFCYWNKIWHKHFWISLINTTVWYYNYYGIAVWHWKKRNCHIMQYMDIHVWNSENVG